MSKHSKTKQQKIIAKLHRKLQLQNQMLYSTSQENKPVYINNKESVKKPLTYILDNKTAPKSSLALETYPYVAQDLLKTGILTGGIVAMQIVLFLLLKNQIIKLPMISF